MSTGRSRKKGREKCLMDKHGKLSPDKKAEKSSYRKMGIPYPTWNKSGEMRKVI